MSPSGHERPIGRRRHGASFALYVVGVCLNRIGEHRSISQLSISQLWSDHHLPEIDDVKNLSPPGQGGKAIPTVDKGVSPP